MMTVEHQKVPIRVVGLSKRYGKTVALSGLSFDAQPGESLALWGANGAGKTTLLKAILGLLDYDGRIEVAGFDVARNSKDARRAIGYVPQELAFQDWKVTTTMSFFARLKGKTSTGGDARERVAPLIEQLGLGDHKDKTVPALSGGLKQRLALAIALLADPPLLLLDEPTANLDARGRQDYLSLLNDLRQRGKTILLASHRLEEVESVTSRVLLLSQGELVETLPSNALRDRLAPEIELSLWVAEDAQAKALAQLRTIGRDTHLNGRGSIVTRIPNADKMSIFELLQAQGIRVMDFETDTWVEREK
jgi:ABC-type multidrug transport system ATPase subunit